MKLGNALGKPVFTLPRPSGRLVLPNAKIGIEIEIEGWGGQSGLTWWEDTRDDSLRNNGREFVTRGGLVGEDVIEALNEFKAASEAHGWQEGTPRAGIHVHVDCTDLDLEAGQLASFISLYMLAEHAIFSWVGEWRRTCGFCAAWEDTQVDFNKLGRALFDKTGATLARAVGSEEFQKYQAVNIMALGKYGTLEFRHLPTTFDVNRILTWINIILQLKKSAVALDTTTPLIAQFSKARPERFLANVLGDMWPTLQPFFKESRAWDAIDNSIALMSYASIISPKKPRVEDLWGETTSGAGWVATKLANMTLAKEPAPAAKPKVDITRNPVQLDSIN